MKARCIHSDVCRLLDETTKDCYDTFTDGTPHDCEYYLSSDFQSGREKLLDDVWKKCNKIERYEHTDNADREYSGGERIIPLNGLNNSLNSVLEELRQAGSP